MTSDPPHPSVLLLLSGIGAFLFFLLVASVTLSNIAQGLDVQLALATYNTHLGSNLTQVLILFSKHGREYFWIPIVAIMAVFGKHRTKILAIELALLFAVGIITGDLIKFLAFRPRPFTTVDGIVARIPENFDSSFPSGHAVIVSIGAVFLLFASFSSVDCKSARIVSIIFAVEAAVVCYSRVYLGLHYPLDVLGGVLLGAAIALVGTFTLESYLPRRMGTAADFIERLDTLLHIPELL